MSMWPLPRAFHIRCVTHMDDKNLLDVWRQMHESDFKFTWKKLHPHPIFVTLDFFLVSELIYHMVTISDIYPGFQIDHSIPYINIELHETSRGPEYWKFNTSLLDDEEFKQKLGCVIDTEIVQDFEDVKIKWEVLKLTIRSHT